MNKFQKYFKEEKPTGFDYMSFKEDIGKISEINIEVAKSLVEEISGNETYKKNKNYRTKLVRDMESKLKPYKDRNKFDPSDISDDYVNTMEWLLGSEFNFLMSKDYIFYGHLLTIISKAKELSIDTVQQEELLAQHESEYHEYSIERALRSLNNMAREVHDSVQLNSSNMKQMFIDELIKLKQHGGDTETINMYLTKYGISPEEIVPPPTNQKSISPLP